MLNDTKLLKYFGLFLGVLSLLVLAFYIINGLNEPLYLLIGIVMAMTNVVLAHIYRKQSNKNINY